MKKSLLVIFILLTLITTTTYCISGIFVSFKINACILLVLAAIKFLLVAFQFMELKKAHVFWKISLLLTLVLFVLLIVSIR